MGSPIRTRVFLRKTLKFSVIASREDSDIVEIGGQTTSGTPGRASSNGASSNGATSNGATVLHIFLDIDEPYTRLLIERAFQHPARALHFCITLGPGVGLDPLPLPPHCDFQWSEYERIDWHGEAGRRHGASSYCIRKGISRKAQLAHYTHRHVCKHPDSVLKVAMPQTVVLDCWPVWDDDAHITNQEGIADVLVNIGSAGRGEKAHNRRKRFDHCLAEARTAMDAAERDFVRSDTSAAPVWILKGSTTNQGAGIYIVHLYEQLVDHCWSDSDIREWFV